MSRVLRMKPGDKILLVKDGGEYEAELVKVDKEAAEAKILDSRPCPGEPKVKITLCAAYMKADKMEFIAQKATELGVSRFQPFFSGRCVKMPEGKSMSKALERMERISWEAVKQCGRAKPMEICLPVDFDQLLDLVGKSENVLFAYEGSEGSLKRALAKARGNICLIVGSEGGFSQEEASRLIQAGARAVSLGSRILRGETAAVALCAIVGYEMGC